MLTVEYFIKRLGEKYGGYKWPFTGMISEWVLEPFANFVLLSELRFKQWIVIDKFKALPEKIQDDKNRNNHTDIWLEVDTGSIKYEIDADLKMDFNANPTGILLSKATQKSFNEKTGIFNNRQSESNNKYYILTMYKVDNSKWHLYCCNYCALYDIMKNIQPLNGTCDVRISWDYIIGRHDMLNSQNDIQPINISYFDKNGEINDKLYDMTCDLIYCNWPGQNKFYFNNFICNYFEEMYTFGKEYHYINKDKINESIILNFINKFNQIQWKYLNLLSPLDQIKFKQIFII